MLKRTALILAALLISGCSRAGNTEYTAGDLRAKNHVAGQNINWFSVNGYRAPGLGGGYCCVMLPLTWTPGLRARIEWEVDPKTASKFPGYQDRVKFNQWKTELEKSFQKHSAIVDIPRYGEARCGITVHFLPCSQVRVTTVCQGYGTPGYPINEPLNMKEPAQCPR